MILEVENKLKQLIARRLEIDEILIVPSAKFIEDLGADSLDIVELLLAIESEFSVEIPEDKAADIVTVADAMNLLDSKQSILV